MPRVKGVKTNKIKDNKNMDSRLRLLKNSLHSYFSNNPNDIKNIFRILNDDYKFNMKYIIWFVTEYSKDNAVIINDTHIYSDFKTTSKTYSKKYFNTIKTGETLNISFDGDIKITTSISQLNFLKWVSNKHIIDYLNKNIDNINKKQVQVEE